MHIFLISFITIYGGMHFYAYFKLVSVFNSRPFPKYALVSWMTVMTFVPLLVRGAEQAKMIKTALSLAWPGYVWMGFVFIFVSIHLLNDVVYYTGKLLAPLFFKQLYQTLHAKFTYRLLLIISIAAVCYSYNEAGRIRYEHLSISTSKLSPQTNTIRIVQISDLHVGLLSQKSRIQSMLKMIKAVNPDIIVSTGDLVDGKLNRDDRNSKLNPLAMLLASVKAPSGKFAIVGNHEVYAGLSEAIKFSEAAGFNVLQNQTIPLRCGITFVGVNDSAAHIERLDSSESEQTLLNSISQKTFRILLKHRPDIVPESDGHFELQLSGHTHDGQIFPFNFLVKLKHKISGGTSMTKSGSQLHVSRGTGTWGPPMRLFATPELTVIDITSQSSSDNKNYLR